MDLLAPQVQDQCASQRLQVAQVPGVRLPPQQRTRVLCQAWCAQALGCGRAANERGHHAGYVAAALTYRRNMELVAHQTRQQVRSHTRGRQQLLQPSGATHYPTHRSASGCRVLLLQDSQQRLLKLTGQALETIQHHSGRHSTACSLGQLLQLLGIEHMQGLAPALIVHPTRDHRLAHAAFTGHDDRGARARGDDHAACELQHIAPARIPDGRPTIRLRMHILERRQAQCWRTFGCVLQSRHRTEGRKVA